MKSIEKYYDNTTDAMPNYTVKKFIKLNVEPGNAVELGCGAGRDTVCLIKNNWNVLAIDRESVEEGIYEKLPNRFEKMLEGILEDVLKVVTKKNK